VRSWNRTLQPVRLDSNDELAPMAEQDRGLWSADLIAEGVGLITAALP